MVHSVRPWLIAALVAGPAASAPTTGVDVRVKEGLVTIDAHEAPLSDVLDQLGRQTGMKLVYEAARPRQIVSASIEGLPQPVALTKLLEGLGVGYSFSLDLTGTRVETLIISGVTGAATASLARPPSPPARPAENGGQLRGGAEVDASEPPEESMPELTSPPEPETAVAAPAANMPSVPGFGVPGSINGGPPSFSPFTGSTMRGPPAFPGAASAPMPFLNPPFIPAVASNPQPLP
jgi:hypothetical protein